MIWYMNSIEIFVWVIYMCIQIYVKTHKTQLLWSDLCAHLSATSTIELTNWLHINWIATERQIDSVLIFQCDRKRIFLDVVCPWHRALVSIVPHALELHALPFICAPIVGWVVHICNAHTFSVHILICTCMNSVAYRITDHRPRMASDRRADNPITCHRWRRHLLSPMCLQYIFIQRKRIQARSG